jgi:ribosome maturation factor RimP
VAHAFVSVQVRIEVEEEVVMGQEEALRALLEPVVAGFGAEVVDLNINGATLDLRVDTPEGGIDLDTIATITKAVSSTLDENDPIPGRYTLEVSSPGRERPLRTPDHFRRFVGTQVSLRTNPDVDGERRAAGELVSAGDETVVIATEAGPRELRYDQIERARTVFEWGPTPKPGSPGSKTKKKKAAR